MTEWESFVIGKDTSAEWRLRRTWNCRGCVSAAYLRKSVFNTFVSPPERSGRMDRFFLARDRNERIVAEGARFTSPRYTVANRRYGETDNPFCERGNARARVHERERGSGSEGERKRVRGASPRGKQVLVSPSVQRIPPSLLLFSPRDTGKMFARGRWHCWPSTTWRFAYGARSRSFLYTS